MVLKITIRKPAHITNEEQIEKDIYVKEIYGGLRVKRG